MRAQTTPSLGGRPRFVRGVRGDRVCGVQSWNPRGVWFDESDVTWGSHLRSSFYCIHPLCPRDSRSHRRSCLRRPRCTKSFPFNVTTPEDYRWGAGGWGLLFHGVCFVQTAPLPGTHLRLFAFRGTSGLEPRRSSSTRGSPGTTVPGVDGEVFRS